MASAPDNNRQLQSGATLLLIAAAIIAALAIGVALWRDHRLTAAQDSPAAKDWRVVGWAYGAAGDSTAAAAAYRRASTLEPSNAENWSSLAETLQSASTSVVPEAAEALGTALKLNPNDPRARYFLAVQDDLRGDHRGALRGWLALLKDAPPGAPWQADLVRTIKQSAELHKIAISSSLSEASAGPAASRAPPGPTAEQLAAASSLSPSQQDAMAQNMVERLAARLAANPNDPDGWIHLIRSYIVLGKADRARQALASGLASFNGDPTTQARLTSAAAELGIRST